MKFTFKKMQKCFFFFGGDQTFVSWRERVRISLGSFLGLTLVIMIAKYLGEMSGVDEWLIASLGASALLVFALPSNPMAQPWAVVAGNTLSALIGVVCFQVFGSAFLALPFAVATSIMGMYVFRCLHPPAAAVALIALLSHISQYRYVVFPVMIDSILLVAAGVLYSNFTGKVYPNRPQN